MYISPPPLLSREEISHQPACLADGKLDYGCSGSSHCSDPGGHSSEFAEYPVSWRCSFSGGPPASLDAGAFQGHRVLSASLHCGGNLWDAVAASSAAWDPDHMQEGDWRTFPATAFHATASSYLDSYPSEAVRPDLGAPEDGFSYLEAHSVAVVGRQLAVRVYREAQLAEFFMQQQVSRKDRGFANS